MGMVGGASKHTSQESEVPKCGWGSRGGGRLCLEGVEQQVTLRNVATAPLDSMTKL